MTTNELVEHPSVIKAMKAMEEKNPKICKSPLMIGLNRFKKIKPVKFPGMIGCRTEFTCEVLNGKKVTFTVDTNSDITRLSNRLKLMACEFIPHQPVVTDKDLTREEIESVLKKSLEMFPLAEVPTTEREVVTVG